MDIKKKVLIVDDDADYVKTLSKILETKDYELVTAENGREGLKKARETKPDIVLLDIMMPVTDGFEVASQFGKDPALANIPILALTSFSDTSGQPFPFEVSEYLSKPISAHDLLEKVERHLKRKGGP